MFIAPGNRDLLARDFAISDPDGNILSFGKEIEDGRPEIFVGFGH